MKKHLYASMTWEEVNDAVRDGRVVLIPVGQIEEHGPHLPIDVDVVEANYLCEEAARRAPDILLSAPPICYGYSEHMMDFPGTISVRAEILINYLFDVGRSFARQGFERIVLVNGHGGNQPMCEVAADCITHEALACCATLVPFALAKDVMAEIRESSIGGIFHAGEAETSQYMYICPELVKKDKIQDEYAPDYRPWRCDDFLGQALVHFTEFWSQRSETGVVGAPSLATPEKGEELLEASIVNLIEFAKWFKELAFSPRTDYKVRKDWASREKKDKKANPN